MGKIGFSCQLSRSEIGLTTDSSHSTWFQRTIFPIEIKRVFHEEDLAQHVLFDTGRRRTRPGSLTKAEPSQDDTDQPFFLHQRSYHFRRNWSSISFPFPFKSSSVFPRPFETPKNGQIPFLRNTYKIRHYKKDNGKPTINYFIYAFHSHRNTCPNETEFETCYPLA